VQASAVESPEHIFSDYAYFSSYSDSWLARAREFASQAITRFALGAESQVIEVASNDGYLLQYFAEAGIPVLGIEPAVNVAAAAVAKGIRTTAEFFGSDLARRLDRRADLLVANNVLAHVPDLNDFVEGLCLALAEEGVLTVEFPHLLHLLGEGQFDTMYHEHLSYFSLLTVRQIFAVHGLRVVDVEELPTHGGSLRVYAKTSGRASDAVDAILKKECAAGLDRIETYREFSLGVQRTREALRDFLTSAKASGHRVAGYGAPAKASTLLGYCGVGTDLLEFTVDRSPHKQGLFLPGVRIPIYAPEVLEETRPDFVLILAWNLRDEIVSTMRQVSDWGGRFVVPIPRVEVLS
jgi:SAM-dependent methyltransferase